MPKPNFYLSNDDRHFLIDVLRSYSGMWDDANPEYIPYDELDKVNKFVKKLKNMEKTKSYNKSLIDEALKLADNIINTKQPITKKKRLSFEIETCGTCKYWQAIEGDWFGYCPKLKEDTESDESCNDYEDIE